MTTSRSKKIVRGNKKALPPARKVKFTPLPPKPSGVVNHFAIVLDSSGSMAALRQSVVDAYNQNVEDLRKLAVKEGHTNTITLSIFGRSVGTEFPRVYEPVDTVPPLTFADYVPTGGTPLFDAVADTIEKLEKNRPSMGDNQSYVLSVFTDGQENESVRYKDGKGMRELIARLKQTERWSFAFTVPRGTGDWFAAHFGIDRGDIQEWEAVYGTVEQRQARYQGMSANFACSNAAFVGSRSSGGTYTSNYLSQQTSQSPSNEQLERLKKAVTDTTGGQGGT